MNTNKRMSIAVMFLATAIIFVASTPVAKNAFAQTIGEEEEVNQVSNTGSQNYENFLTCLSDAGGQHSYPAGNQIVNCLVESGYVQGSSSQSNSNDDQSNSNDDQSNSNDDQSNSNDDQSNSNDDQSNSNDDQSDDQSNSNDDQSDDQSNSNDDQSDNEE
jgi:hypothetical protein